MGFGLMLSHLMDLRLVALASNAPALYGEAEHLRCDAEPSVHSASSTETSPCRPKLTVH